jgi:hypothetical protein
MAERQGDDAWFERVARGLAAVRQDAELIRSGGAEGLSAGLAQFEAELRRLASGVEGLNQRNERQQATIARLEAAFEVSEKNLQGLRQTIDDLSRRLQPERDDAPALLPIRGQASPGQASVGQAPGGAKSPIVSRSGSKSSAGNAPSSAALIGTAFAVLLVCGGAAAWIASGREPTVYTLTDRFVMGLSNIIGVDLAGSTGSLATAREPASASAAPPALPASTASAEPPAEVSSAAPPAQDLSAAPPAQDLSAAPPAEVSSAAPPARDLSVAPLAEVSSAARAERAAVAGPLVTAPPAAPAAVASAAAPLATGRLAPGASGGSSGPAGATQAAAPPPRTGPPVTAADPAQAATAIPAASAMPAPAGAQSAPTIQAAATPGGSSRPVPAPHQLVLRATADTWVQVHDKGGRMLLRRIMKSGDTWPVPAETDLILDSGNASGLQVELDGVPRKLAGAKGSVIHDVPLDVDHLGAEAARSAH